MPGPRLLLRCVPLLGAVAAVVWLRRRRAERPSLPAPRPPARLDPPRQVSGRFARAPEGALGEVSVPLKAAAAEPVDIVTVVDDLLEAGR